MDRDRRSEPNLVKTT